MERAKFSVYAARKAKAFAAVLFGRPSELAVCKIEKFF